MPREKKKVIVGDWDYIEHGGCRFCAGVPLPNGQKSPGDLYIKRNGKKTGKLRDDYYWLCKGQRADGGPCRARGQFEQHHLEALLKHKKIVPC